MTGNVDLIIRGGHILDGTGSAGFDADTAILADKIVSIGVANVRGRVEGSAKP